MSAQSFWPLVHLLSSSQQTSGGKPAIPAETL
nr:MAG TPA: hypothetical protein [Caudoviricetes sp.]